MFKRFVKIFIRDSENVGDATVREKYGRLTGITGIFLNVILCVSKIITGLVTGAISVLSDGVNNLSDAGSSVITLIGFKLSAKKPDRDHPFGHGRMEYFAGLAVSVIIIIVAFELLSDSIGKIISRSSPSFESEAIRYITIAVLAASIVVKLWMALFNRYCGKKIDSVAMRATALDSISDCISTSVVLGATVAAMFFPNAPIDGIAGVVVSIFIGYTGVKSVKEIVDLLLGTAPGKEFVDAIGDYICTYDDRIVGIHDLLVHDYGPGRKMITVHVEVPAKADIMSIHDVVDNIERGLEKHFGCLATIHMDPVETDSERVTFLKEKCLEIVKTLDADVSIHDFRMNEGDTHANLIFDVVFDRDTSFCEEQVAEYVNKRLAEFDEKLTAVIKVEYSYV